MSHYLYSGILFREGGEEVNKARLAIKKEPCSFGRSGISSLVALYGASMRAVWFSGFTDKFGWHGFDSERAENKSAKTVLLPSNRGVDYGYSKHETVFHVARHRGGS